MTTVENNPSRHFEQKKSVFYEVIERPRQVDFNKYREICDSANTFRRLGILDEDKYQEAANDPRTSHVLTGSQLIPAVVPIEYEERYANERCQELTGSDNVMFLALPELRVQEELAGGAALIRGEQTPADFSIVAENYHKDSLTPERKKDIADALGSLGVHLIPQEFVDDRLENLETNRTAWMGIYGMTLASNRERDAIVSADTPEKKIEAAWQQCKVEKQLPEMPPEDYSGAFLFDAEQLRMHPELVDQLWAISEIGFGEVLGKNHPISMEVTKGFFDEHITSESVFTCVSFDKGEPVCFGFFAPNMEHNDWLNSDSTLIKSEIENAEKNNQVIAHFFELISTGKKGLSLSTPILSLLYDVASRISPSTRIIFESTNLSATYIPYIAEKMANDSPNLTVDKRPEQLDELNYWFLKQVD